MNRTRTPFLWIVPLLLLAGAAITPLWARPEAKEPPLLFELSVGGEMMTVQLDEPFTVNVGGTEVRMRLSGRPHRVFENSPGITFRYPSHMSWSYDGSTPEVTNWSISGNETEIMLFRFNDSELSARETLETLVGELVAGFGRDRASVTDDRMNLGGQRLPSKKIRVEIFGEVLYVIVTSFAKGNDSYAFTLQYSVTTTGGMPDETREVLDLLQLSFELPR